MRKRILIIEDSEIDREILDALLCMDFDIETAENGFEGIERILKTDTHFDGILLDLHMPIMNGFSVLEVLKHNEIKDIPVVIITAEATSDNLLKTLPFNIADFICKPYDPNVVVNRLKAVIK